MRVVQVYNQQRSIGGGEEKVVLQTTEWLKERGIETDLLLRSSRDLENGLSKKVKAAMSGIYSREAYRFMRNYIDRHHPTVVHAHNLFPLWSPSVLAACRDAGVPTLFTVHCQILTCPTWYHLYRDAVCEKCLESGEHWCVLKNCRDNYLESFVYALRSFVIRKKGFFKDNVSTFIAPSQFMRDRLVKVGFAPERVRTVWNAVEIPEQSASPASGEYVAFAGRLSTEKGLRLLVEVARRLPGVPFRIAGTGPAGEMLRQNAPANVTFTGFLSRAELEEFYRKARFLVVPSLCYETFSLSTAEGLANGLPVAGSDIGAIGELIQVDGNGLLIEPGNEDAWVHAVEYLWNAPGVCAEMGAAGRAWAEKNLTKENYIERLLTVYRDLGNTDAERDEGMN